MRSMGSVGTLFACIDLISTAVAGAEWKLYRTHDGRGKIANEDNRVEVTSHAAIDLLNQPNSFYTRQHFIQTVQQHLDLTGEGSWVIGRDPRASWPMELWPVRPDRVTPVPSVRDFLSGYIYTAPDGEKVPLQLDELTRLMTPNPLDPYRGLSAVSSMLTSLDASKAAAEWNLNFFNNSAQPGGIIELDGTLSDDEFDQFTSRWREQHQGVSRAHKVAVLEQGTWKSNAFTMKDMQFAELRQVNRDAIMEVFRIHKGMLGITENVNKANANAGEYMFTKWIVVPRLERWKHTLNYQLLPLFGSQGQGLEFDYEPPTVDNVEEENFIRDSKAKAVALFVAAGYNPDDVLANLGLPPMRFKAPAKPVAAIGGADNGEPVPAGG